MHRKVHLFDIDIPGKITFKVSIVLTLVTDAAHDFLVCRRAKR